MSFDDQKQMDIAILDISKVFESDTVPHHKLNN